MHEQIIAAAIGGYKAKSLEFIEPFNGTSQSLTIFLLDFMEKHQRILCITNFLGKLRHTAVIKYAFALIRMSL